MNAEQRRQIGAIYMEMYEKLMVYARACLDSEALAEEAVQETFRIACQKPGALCHSANYRGWLITTLKNTIKNMKITRGNAKKILERYLVTQVKEFSFLEDGVRLNVLYEDVADTEEFKLLSELAIDGRSYEEMASVRGITVSACRKRIQRAKEVLQKKI